MTICEKIQQSIPDYLTGQIELSAKKEFDAHLLICEVCQKEVATFEKFWKSFVEIPSEKPGGALRSRFYAMLETEKQRIHQRETKLSWYEKLELWWHKIGQHRFTYRLAYSLVLLLIGFLVGSQISNNNGDIIQLKKQVNELRYIASASLLNQPSSSNRLRGISYTAQMSEPQQPLIQMLFHTLNEDPNVNIRLAAIDALFLFIDQQGVRTALIQSLAKQTSPLVQINLIDLIAQIKEKQALEALNNLIKKNNLNPSVKQHAQEKIKYLL